METINPTLNPKLLPMVVSFLSLFRRELDPLRARPESMQP